MFHIVKDTIWGDCQVRFIRGTHGNFLRAELLQVRGNEFTSRGFHWVPRSRFQLGKLLRSRMTYLTEDLFDAPEVNLAEKKKTSSAIIGFPQRLQIKQYSTPQLKIFVREWKQADSISEVANRLGIPEKKTIAIARYLRRHRVLLPIKSDEKEKTRRKKKIDWLHFVRATKGAKFLETAANAIGMEFERYIYCCVWLQKRGVRIIIPPFMDEPEWIKIRMGEDLKQRITIRSKHGSGKKYKQRWAGYKREMKVNTIGFEWLSH